MDDPLRMDVLDSVDNAEHERLDLGSDEVSPHVDQLVERLVGAELQENVDVIFVLKAMLELNYVRMMEGFVKTDFVGQPETGPVRFQVLLQYYFGG